MTSTFTESVVEDVALAGSAGLGYHVVRGPDIAPGELGAEESPLRCTFGSPTASRALRP